MIAKYESWLEAVQHELDKDPNMNVVFLQLGIKQV
jgi:hypothetical protein